MSTTALPHPTTAAEYPQAHYENRSNTEPDWIRLAVGGGLLTGALLLLTGKRRAGIVVSAAATALTLLEEQDTVRSWWNSLPQYLNDAQRLLDQAQHAVDDLAQKREKLRSMFNR